MRLRNRITLLPHGVYFADRSTLLPTERHRDYYAARARGGVGLVCVETSVVSQDARSANTIMVAGNRGTIPGYRAIADAVHAEGACVSGQISHQGSWASSAVTRRPLLSVSRLPDPGMRELGLPLDRT